MIVTTIAFTAKDKYPDTPTFAPSLRQMNWQTSVLLPRKMTTQIYRFYFHNDASFTHGRPAAILQPHISSLEKFRVSLRSYPSYPHR